MTTRTVTLQGPTGPVEALLPEITTRLPDGSVGYYQRRQDDCARAALATVLQLPYDEIPPFDQIAVVRKRQGKPVTHADQLQSIAETIHWTRQMGWRMQFANRPPPGIDTFIGVSPADEAGWRHTVAVVKGHVFDPGDGFILPPGFESPPVKIEHIEFFV